LKGKFVPQLRKLIVRLLFVVPFVYGIAAVSLPAFVFSLIRSSADYRYEDGELRPQHVALMWVVRLALFLLGISPAAICITSAVAGVQFFRGKQSGRTWAIGCGVAFLACSLPILVGTVFLARNSVGDSNGWVAMSAFNLIQVAAGILMLIAFLPRESASEPLFQNARPERVKGDGTTSISLLVAIAVMVGGCFAGDSLCRRWALRANLPTDVSLVHANLVWFGALIFAITCHELGHAIAGKMVGMKLFSFRIGPLQAVLDEGRWHLVMPRTWKSVLGAGVGMIPGNPLIYDRRQAIIGAAGGALANLIVGSIALLSLLRASGSSYESYWDLLSQLTIFNFVFFAVNLIPAREAAAYSDGARIYQIVTGSMVEDYRRILSIAQAGSVTPIRPRDFDIELIDRIAATTAPGFDRVFLLLIASDYYFDRGETESAKEKFREAEARCDEQTSWWAERCGSIVLRAACLLEDREMSEK
jgi:hypothetical protein